MLEDPELEWLSPVIDRTMWGTGGDGGGEVSPTVLGGGVDGSGDRKGTSNLGSGLSSHIWIRTLLPCWPEPKSGAQEMARTLGLCVLHARPVLATGPADGVGGVEWGRHTGQTSPASPRLRVGSRAGLWIRVSTERAVAMAGSGRS